MATTAADQQSTDERLVYDWRVEQFEKMRDAGDHPFTIRQVHELANGECDLRRAEALLQAGCAAETAFEILN